MKLSYIILSTIVSASVHSAFASDKDVSVQKWKTIDEVILSSLSKGKKEGELILPTYSGKSGWSGGSYICYDTNGDEISQSECDDAMRFVTSLHGRKLESVKVRWQKDKCRTRLDDGFCKSDYQGLKGSNAQLQKFLEENRVIALKTVPLAFQKYQALVEENLAQLEPIEQQLNNPEDIKKVVKQKLNSKECKLYHVTADICRKAHVEAAANKGLAVEEEATKQSGVVNRYSRYKLGQLKALHGTGNLAQLKKKYRELTGSEWIPKTCEASPDEKRKVASGEIADESEEIQACGCSGLDCQDIN